jgi:hypothetical protein
MEFDLFEREGGDYIGFGNPNWCGREMEENK